MQMDVDADRLRGDRDEGLAQDQQRMEGRALDLICRELECGLAAPDAHVAAAGAGDAQREETGRVRSAGTGQPASAGAAPAPGARAATRLAAALALVEKIEVFLRSRVPALALTLSGGLEATVEVERTGPREIALRIAGTRAPPAPEDLARIREALGQRGLRLTALSIG